MNRPAFWTLWWFGILVCLTPAALAFWQTRDSTYNLVAAAGGGGSCAQSTAYFAATSLDATHKTAIDTLICGRVTSGVFAKMDVWNMFATTNAADARKNMVTPGTFDTTVIGSPNFTPDRGYDAVTDGSANALNTNFNPTIATPHYGASSGNSGHLSAWSNTNHLPASNTVEVGLDDVGAVNNSFLSAELSSGNADFIVNASGFSGGVIVSDSLGHYVATRTSSSNVDAYKNGTNVASLSGQTSAPVANGTFYVLALNIATAGVGSINNASQRQTMTFSIGGTLTGADITDLCHATNVYLTTIAGVSGGIC